MISWIRGEIIDTWMHAKKFYVLINCQGLGYEVQILESLKKDLCINKLSRIRILSPNIRTFKKRF